MARVNRTVIGISLAVVLMVAAVVGYLAVYTNKGPAGGTASIGGPFTLVNQDGKTVTEADFKGKYQLIYFGYTYCPDVCPTTLTAMSDAITALGAKGDKVTPIFITIDPARDTVEQLKMYVGYFGPRMVGLTGTPEQIAAAAKAYRVYYAKVPEPGNPEGDAYSMDHSSIVYFMSPDGLFLSNFGHDDDGAVMAKKMSAFL
jgi:protein SCO1/2